MAKTALVSQAFPLTLCQYYEGVGTEHYFETACMVEFGSTFCFKCHEE